MGKRISEARGEVEFSSSILAYYAANAERFLADEELHPTVGEAHMESSPIGVIFGVEPWNFPYYQLARVAGPHLMAGNVLVVKHAACVPQCAIAFEKLLTDAGAPAGLYTNLLISHDQANRVIDDPRIKGVALTGSVPAGRSIAARAGQNLKPSSMELGGSDAFIVLEDADLDHTMKWAVWGRMYNTGQTCCAAKRFIVVGDVADKFLARFKTELEALKAGDPLDVKTTMGPLSTEGALVQLLGQVDQAVASGAKLVMGGKRVDRPGSYMQPTILTDVAPGNPAYRDEFFGPGRDDIPCQERGRSHRAGQRFRFRPGRIRVHQGPRPRPTGRQPCRDRHDVHQQHLLVGCRTSLRWHQELRLRARTRQHGDPGLRQQEAGPPRGPRSAGLVISRSKKEIIMDKTMHAAVVEEFGKPLVFREYNVPPPGPGQILVKTEACGVCHTDLHAAEGDWPLKPTLPFIPGHEGIGRVAAVGAGVTIVKEGDRVGVPWLYSACGHCEHCLAAWGNRLR